MKYRAAVQKFTAAATVVSLLLMLILCILGVRAGIFRDIRSLRDFIARCGAWGPLIFLAVQLTQILFPFLPGGVTLTAGVVIFGPALGFVYNYVGIVLGSTISFLLARRFGQPFVQAMVPEQIQKKYLHRLNSVKAQRIFAVAILLPFAPDDALCMLAGLTTMPFTRFLAILLLCKPISIVLYSLGFMSLSLTSLF